MFRYDLQKAPNATIIATRLLYNTIETDSYVFIFNITLL